MIRAKKTIWIAVIILLFSFQAQAKQRLIALDGYTGGTGGKLDSILVGGSSGKYAALQEGDICEVFDQTTHKWSMHYFHLFGSAQTESSPNLVKPDWQSAGVAYTGYGAWVKADLDESIVEADLSLSDITTGDATTSRHGLLPKLSGVSTAFLDGNGSFYNLATSINSGVPNGTGSKIHWSQLTGVPAGFADGTDDGAGGSSFDPASPGPIGGTTPSTGTFTEVIVVGTSPGGIKMNEASANGMNYILRHAPSALSANLDFTEANAYPAGNAYLVHRNMDGTEGYTDPATLGGEGGMTYPGAGIPNSTGSAWGTSYTVGTGANNLVQLNASAQLPAVSGANLTGLDDDNVSFDDGDNLFTASTVGAALEEFNNSINDGACNGSGAKVHWSQLLGVPAGLADGTDDGAGGVDHDAVTLGADADVLLGLSTQQITFDTQTANYVFAGPTTGAAADPTFRALVTGDLPSGATLDAEWDSIAEIEAATGVNIIVNTEIDSLAELNSIVGSTLLSTSSGLDASNINTGTIGVAYLPSDLSSMTSLILPSNIIVGAAGVKLTGDGDGAITFLGLGDGSDEDLTLNLDDTANTAKLSSSTGVTTMDFSAINLVTTGTIHGGLPALGSFAAPITSTGTYSLAAENCWGGVVFYNDTDTLALPPAVAGMSVCIYVAGANLLTVDPNGTDVIVVDGTANAAGDAFTVAGAAGNFVCLVADAANHWITLGAKGALTAL
jgi:hypothetical protein